jgi:hypothetical protein
MTRYVAVAPIVFFSHVLPNSEKSEVHHIRTSGNIIVPSRKQSASEIPQGMNAPDVALPTFL